ncbi:MAG: hypothetical protein U1E05_00125, partial [Patescibacteria group bacterium]|nr:hypothetical protein [Patescibacteria group bacterium]
VFAPGAVLAGDFWLRGLTLDEVKAVETSVLWYTEGKGDEDMAVHAFWRASADAGDWITPNRPNRFETTLPRAPLSYTGVILKVRWCVRVRAFLQGGKEISAQRVFQLGSIPNVELAQP